MALQRYDVFSEDGQIAAVAHADDFGEWYDAADANAEIRRLRAMVLRAHAARFFKMAVMLYVGGRDGYQAKARREFRKQGLLEHWAAKIESGEL